MLAEATAESSQRPANVKSVHARRHAENSIGLNHYVDAANPKVAPGDS